MSHAPPPTPRTILLTGGSGDLGTVLTPMLLTAGWRVRRMDPRPPSTSEGDWTEGSILDSEALTPACSGARTVVHIAAWHGIHEHLGLRTPAEFQELNVDGTACVLKACSAAGVRGLVFLSSTSVRHSETVYGRTKIEAEGLVRDHAAATGLNTVILRPRAFIPPWNRSVYPDFTAWANRFLAGGVQISDVARAVCLAVEATEKEDCRSWPPLPLDGHCPYTAEQLASWDSEGPGTTFASVFPEHVAAAARHGVEVWRRPSPLCDGAAHEFLSYRPAYTVHDLFRELRSADGFS